MIIRAALNSTLAVRKAPTTSGYEVASIVSEATRQHERKVEWLGATWGQHRGHVKAWSSLISDVHSPFDYTPVHARWDVAY
jgi:hypothetical protein